MKNSCLLLNLSFLYYNDTLEKFLLEIWWNFNQISEFFGLELTKIRHCLVCTFSDFRSNKAKIALFGVPTVFDSGFSVNNSRQFLIVILLGH